MKKNTGKKLILIIMLTLTLTTGCTKYLSDNDKKRITNEKTGQSLTSNILCKPEEKELTAIYEKYEKNMEVKLKDLPSCEKLKIYNKKTYNGLWVQLFVMPIAWLIIKLGLLVKNYGISVMLIGLALRIILLPLSLKTAKQSENMKKAQPELEKLEKKYKDKTDSDSMMQKSQETMLIYKKYDINPVSGCLVSFIQLPLFFAFLEAINRVPAIFEENLWSLQLGTTPIVGFGTSTIVSYIIVMLLIALSTFASFKLNMSGNSQDPNMKMMPLMMSVMIIVMGLFMPSALGIYWITTNLFTVFQNILVKRSKDNHGKTYVHRKK